MASREQGRQYSNIRSEGLRNIKNNTPALREGFVSEVNRVNDQEKEEMIQLLADLNISQTNFSKKLMELDGILNNFPLKNKSFGNTIVSTPNTSGYITNLGIYKPASDTAFSDSTCSDANKITKNAVLKGKELLIGEQGRAMQIPRGTDFIPGAPCNTSGTNVYVKQNIDTPNDLENGPYAGGKCLISKDQYESTSNIENTLKGMGKVVDLDTPDRKFTKEQCMEQAGIMNARFYALQRNKNGSKGQYDCWVGNSAYGDAVLVNRITDCYNMPDKGSLINVPSASSDSDTNTMNKCGSFALANGFRYFGVQKDNWTQNKFSCYVAASKNDDQALQWATSKGIKNNWAAWTIYNGGASCNPITDGTNPLDCVHGSAVGWIDAYHPNQPYCVCSPSEASCNGQTQIAGWEGANCDEAKYIDCPAPPPPPPPPKPSGGGGSTCHKSLFNPSSWFDCNQKTMSIF